MNKPDVDRTWKRLQELLPLHECGERLQPAATPDGTEVVICTSCSYVELVDPEWVHAKVQEAVRSVQNEETEG